MIREWLLEMSFIVLGISKVIQIGIILIRMIYDL